MELGCCDEQLRCVEQGFFILWLRKLDPFTVQVERDAAGSLGGRDHIVAGDRGGGVVGCLSLFADDC